VFRLRRRVLATGRQRRVNFKKKTIRIIIYNVLFLLKIK
jgi:hypothetical protein